MFHACTCTTSTVHVLSLSLSLNHLIYHTCSSYRDGKMVVLACDWNWNSSFDHRHYLMASTTGI